MNLSRPFELARKGWNGSGGQEKFLFIVSYVLALGVVVDAAESGRTLFGDDLSNTAKYAVAALLAAMTTGGIIGYGRIIESRDSDGQNFPRYPN
jgi:hypothetical protein